MQKNNTKIDISKTAIDLFKEYIISALVRESGFNNRKAAERCVHKKYENILADLTRIYFSSLEHNWFRGRPEVKVYLSKLYESAWGRFSVNGKQYWLNSLLKYYFFMVWREGDNFVHSASAIEFKKPIVVNAIKQYAKENPHIFKGHREKHERDASIDYFDTPIDINSLHVYINKLAVNFSDEPYLDKYYDSSLNENHLLNIIEARRRKSQQYWKYANEINNALLSNGDLRQVGSSSNAGRLYLKGVNLQRAPKEVRHAALGYSVSYDMRCGALGVFAALANNFTYGTKKFHYIRNYIINRHEIRAAITRDLYSELIDDNNIKAFHGYQKIKAAFTAIGFGARKSATGYWKSTAGNWKTSSLKSILGDRVALFLKHGLVKNIIEEYELAADIIYSAYQHDNAFFNYLANKSVLANTLSKKQLLAHIYQHFESVILVSLINGAQKQGAELLLPLHDGAYFDRSFDCRGICGKLPFICDNSFIQFEKSVHRSQANKRDSVSEDSMATHQQFIEREEEIASSYRDKSILSTVCDGRHTVSMAV